MDLGIAGRRALVCAASKGLGRGCAEALAREGVEVTIVARTEDALKRTAEEIGARAWVACVIAPPARNAAATMAASVSSASLAPARRALFAWISMQ